MGIPSIGVLADNGTLGTRIIKNQQRRIRLGPGIVFAFLCLQFLKQRQENIPIDEPVDSLQRISVLAFFLNERLV